MAGSKFNESHDLLVRNHRAVSNQTRGLWFDSDTVNLSIESCELGRNFSDGIFIYRTDTEVAALDLSGK